MPFEDQPSEKMTLSGWLISFGLAFFIVAIALLFFWFQEPLDQSGENFGNYDQFNVGKGTNSGESYGSVWPERAWQAEEGK